MRKLFKTIFLLLTIIVLAFAGYFLVGKTEPAKEIVWGVNFSQKHAERMGLDWKKTYLALFDDLGVRDIKIASYWDLIEPKQGKYDFADLDWQIEEAGKRGAKVILVIGMKTPRWPECHIPEWANKLDKKLQQEEIMNLLEAVVLRYKNKEAVRFWQVENEPFFPFGNCPWYDKEFLKKEIELIKLTDNLKRPVIISDTGEFSFWTKAARYADIVGITMYKKVWSKEISRYVNNFLPAVFYKRRAGIIKNIFKKEIICVELQAEPWGPALLYDSPLEEQEKTMNLVQFRKNIEFAKRTGLDRFYFWGAEWWYWLKEKQNKSEIWKEAKKIINN